MPEATGWYKLSGMPPPITPKNEQSRFLLLTLLILYLVARILQLFAGEVPSLLIGRSFNEAHLTNCLSTPAVSSVNFRRLLLVTAGIPVQLNF